MKKCPFCAEEIQEEAKVCRFCHMDLIKGESTLMTQNKPEEVKTKSSVNNGVRLGVDIFIKLLLIIIGIIVGLFIFMAILASFSSTQYSKDSKRAIAFAEAVPTIDALRESIARYYQEYNALTDNIALLDIDDPSEITTRNFDYSIDTSGGINGYTITATPGTSDGYTRGRGICVTYDASNNKRTFDYDCGE